MKEVLEQIGELMAISARTAPKSGGKDFVNILVLKGDDIQKLGAGMVQYGEENDIPGFIRDGKNVLSSDALVLIGIRDAAVMNLNCGACGHDSCKELNPVRYCSWISCENCFIVKC